MSLTSLFENTLVQGFCLLIFVFLLVYLIIAFLNKMFPNWKKNLFKEINELDIKVENKCSSLTTHNFPDNKSNTKCVWCGKSIKELIE